MMPRLQIGFRGRLIAAMVALAALVSLVIGALMMVYLFEDEQDRAQEQLTIGARVTSEVMARRRALELSRLDVVVKDFGFLSAVASRDSATLDSALENHSARAGADLALLLDNQGKVMASTLNHPLSTVPEALLTEAREKGFASRMVVLDDAGYELLAVPVQAPGLRAWLLAGYRLDNELAGIIAELSGTGVLFRIHAENAPAFPPFATSLDKPLQNDGPVEATGLAFNAHYFTRIIDLGPGNGERLQALLLISREASLQSYYQRAVEIGLLVLASLALAILLALILARFLGRPVLQLADYARAIGDGETPEPPRIVASGELRQLRNALRDMLARLREREAHIRYTATHDEVTGLANRTAILEAVDTVFEEHRPCTLLGIRLVDLSNINDTLGLELGDRVLVGTAKRLQQHLPEAHLIARTGGREFLALVPHLDTEILIDDAADSLHRCFDEPLQIDHTPFVIRTITVAMQLPADAGSINEFRRRLNLTFDRAHKGGESVLRYRPGLDENHLRKLQLIGDLHQAIRDDQLHMQYQPKLDLRSGKLIQVEALVRWIHPTLGFISPEEFIFLAEQSGQINELTACVLRQVSRDARSWATTGLDVGVAVNLSAKDLTWNDLSDHVARAFAQWHQPMDRITLEVTESALMEDPDKALATLNRLRDLGVTLSVDDFGTGYSSLSQLRKLPVQELKIDKSFVLDLDTEPQDQLIVRSTIDMAHGLGLKVVAEGIEELASWHLLRRWGCNLGQGFGLSRPVSADALAEAAAQLATRIDELTQTPTENP